MKKLVLFVLCAVLTATMLVSCGAPKDLSESYLKGEWVAKCGLSDIYGDEFEELGLGTDLSDVEVKLNLVLKFDGEGVVEMYVEEGTLDKYFDEALESVDSDVKEIIDILKEELKESFKGESGYELGDNVVNINGTEYEYKEGALTCEEPELTFEKK